MPGKDQNARLSIKLTFYMLNYDRGVYQRIEPEDAETMVITNATISERSYMDLAWEKGKITVNDDDEPRMETWG